MSLETIRNPDGLIEAVFHGEGRRPPLLTAGVLAALEELVAAAESKPPAGLIFRADGEGDFQAGVNLEAMAEVRTAEEARAASRTVQLLYERIARLSCPVVAAVSGRCLGGGTELILACHARLATDDTSTAIALPEINLGLIPGYGGTQRLPRIVGQQAALNMILTGNPVGARKALETGLVDRLAPPGQLRETATELVHDLQAGRAARLEPRPRLTPTDWMLERTRRGRRLVRERYARVTRRRTGGHYPAPEMAIEAIGLAAEKTPLERGLEREAEMIAELMAGEVHPHLLGLLRARQALRRPRGTDPESGEPSDLAAGFDPPAELTASLRRIMETAPWPAEADRRTGLPARPGCGVLRRLPRALPPTTVEIAWAGDGEPAGFPDTARHLIAAAGMTPLFTRSIDTSPGLALLAAYLREGDRLWSEGWEKDRVDEILQAWGMKYGPFALAEALGEPWLAQLDDLPQRPVPEPLEGGTAPTGNRATDKNEAGLIEEVIAALWLEMERLHGQVAEPVAEGWLVLDVFVLGGPAFRGGLAGAARLLGRASLTARLDELARRYGAPYCRN